MAQLVLCRVAAGLPVQCRVAAVVLMNVSLLLKDLISDFYLTSLQLVLCRVAAVKRLPVHQP